MFGWCFAINCGICKQLCCLAIRNIIADWSFIIILKILFNSFACYGWALQKIVFCNFHSDKENPSSPFSLWQNPSSQFSLRQGKSIITIFTPARKTHHHHFHFDKENPSSQFSLRQGKPIITIFTPTRKTHHHHFRSDKENPSSPFSLRQGKPVITIFNSTRKTHHHYFHSNKENPSSTFLFTNVMQWHWIRYETLFLNKTCIVCSTDIFYSLSNVD